MASRPTHSPGRPGWVYVLTNPAFGGLVKIGHTARHPEIRVAELSSATGVPARFVVAWAHQVKDHEALEGLAHGRLADYRANDNREFFRCSVGQARRIIEQEARAQLLPWWGRLLYRLTHRMPAQRRARSGRRRRSSGDATTPIGVVMGLTIGGVIMFRPWWLPAWLLHLVQQLPGMH